MGLFRRNGKDEVEVEHVQAPAPVGTPIFNVVPREEVTVVGTVTRIRTLPRTGLPSLSITIEDATGAVSAVWSGRRAIGGITLGRSVALSGIAVQGSHELEFHNPAYTLLA